MEGTGDETETINVWELMRGLDDDEDSPQSKEFPTASLLNQRTAPAVASARLPSDSFTLEPSDVKEIPQWLSSFPILSSHGRSVAGPSEGLIRDASTFGNARSKSSGTTSHASELFGDKPGVSPHESLAEHLHRSLSFEKSSPKNEMKSIFGQKDAFDAHQSKGFKMGFGTDVSSFTSTWLLSKAEAVGSPSSPSFSGSVNIKKWFQNDSRTPNPRQDLKAVSKVSGHEPQSKLPPPQGTPPLVHAMKVSGPSLKATGGSYNIGSYANSDEGAYHTPTSHNVGAQHTPPVGYNKAPQEGHARRFRHSFSDGNRNKQLTDERNRPSSWELERSVPDPKVKVVLYSTSSPADAHAFDDSNAVRAILISLVGSSFDEKSISQHPEYEQELKNA
eukprot:c15723_g2_i1 orf=402-1571(+)